MISEQQQQFVRGVASSGEAIASLSEARERLSLCGKDEELFMTPRRYSDESSCEGSEEDGSLYSGARPRASSRFPLLEAARFVDATISMFLDELCVAYDLEGRRFRAFLVKRVQASASKSDHFDPEEWIARYCQHEAKARGAFETGDFMGWLAKKGRINRAWRRRLFWLDGSNTLRYARDIGEPARGDMELCGGCDVVEALDSTEERRVDLGFAIRTPHRTLYIRADDEWQHKAWVAMLRSVVNRQPPGNSEGYYSE